MNRHLLKVFTPLTTISRSKGFKHSGGVRYPGGIVFYPRNPEQHKDPEDYVPPKLFRVERIKPVKNNPWWLKGILAELRIGEDNDRNRVAIVKNIPEINSKLWKIKHLVKITPITFPYGEPTEEDVQHTILKENGQCLVTKTLAPAPEQVAALEQFDSDDKKMDSTTIKRDTRHRWNNAYTGGF